MFYNKKFMPTKGECFNGIALSFIFFIFGVFMFIGFNKILGSILSVISIAFLIRYAYCLFLCRKGFSSLELKISLGKYNEEQE